MRVLTSRAAFVVSLAVCSPLLAGGPRAVNGQGEPMAWPTGAPVVYNPESGPLGLLSNTEARALVSEAFSLWGALPGPQTVFADDMESGVGGWTTSGTGANPWSRTTTRSYSGATSWFVADLGSETDSFLVMETLSALPAGATLRFRHAFDLEERMDGGVLEYSADGGGWTDARMLITQGGYDQVIDTRRGSHIAGRRAWTGRSAGWVETVVDLSSLAGSDVRLRWRAVNDDRYSAYGWHVDDVKVTVPRPAALTFAAGAPIAADINAAGTPYTNASHYVHYWRVDDDGLAPILFDADGSIIDDMFGEGARFDILGASGLDTSPLDPAVITGASIVLNGAFYDGVPSSSGTSPDDLSREGMKGVIVHEIGHFVNLDHSVLNAELADDADAEDDVYVPVMFPFAVDDPDRSPALAPDDRAAFLALYGGVSSSRVAGSVLDSGGVPLQGAMVVARKIDDPLGTAYASFSGDRFFPCHAGSTCDPCTTTCDPGDPPEQGLYTLEHLDPGDYRVCLRQIDVGYSGWTNSYVGPLATPRTLPGPEDCRDAAESASDDPDTAQSLTVGAVTGADIRLNATPVSDPYEPNDDVTTPTALPDLPTWGHETIGATVVSGDADYYAIPVVAGRRVRVDIDAAEIGSSLDAVLRLYDDANALVATVDDTYDPDSDALSLDPALEAVPSTAGTLKIAVAPYSNAAIGPYWLRVSVPTDGDGDGVDDLVDDCPTVRDPVQGDRDLDGFGNACDADRDGDGLLDVYETRSGTYVDPTDTGTDPQLADSDGDGTDDRSETSAGTDPNDPSEHPEVFGAVETLFGSPRSFLDVVAGDIDGDGDPDLVACVDDWPASDKVVWIESARGSWTGWNVIASVEAVPERALIADLNRDGHPDVVAAFAGRVSWWAQSGSGWSVEIEISASVETPGRLASGDMDRDGDIDVLTTSGAPNGQVVLHKNDGTGSTWTPVILQTYPAGANSVAVVDLDADGDLDVVHGGADADNIQWQENTGSGSFGAPDFINARPATRLRSIGDLDGDGDPDVLAVSCPVDTSDALFWYENDGTPGGLGDWVERQIAAPMGCEGSAVPLDVDGDGDLDIVRGGYNELPATVRWHENLDGAGRFGPAVDTLHGEAGTAPAVTVADFDVDGDGDVAWVTEPIPGELDWAANATMHRRALFPVRSAATTSAEGASGVFVSDLDGDGDPDVAYASADDNTIGWIEFRGGVPWSEQTVITTATGASGVVAADLNRDGAVDLVSSSAGDNGIRWYQSNGGSPPSFTVRAVSTVAMQARAVFASDLDRDGDLDLLSASSGDDTIRWYRNNGLAVPTFTPINITVLANEAWGVHAADLDGDGDPDVISADRGDNAIRWYQSNGATPPTFTRRTITTAASGARSVWAADIDGDGRLDVLSASEADGKIAWYRNGGEPTPSFTARTIATLSGAAAVFAADLDADGDVDVAAAAAIDGRVHWFENVGGTPVSFVAHVAAGSSPGADAIHGADLDRNGTFDLVSASAGDDTIASHFNGGGSAAFAAAGVAPSQAIDGASFAALSVAVSHRGRTGDPAIAVASLAFTIRDGSGSGMDAGHRAVLFEAIAVHRDADGSGTFSPALDPEIGRITVFHDGLESVPIPFDEPLARIAYGESKTFWIVPTLTAVASRGTPSSFRLDFVPTASHARDTASMRLVRSEWGDSVTSGTVAAISLESTPPLVAAVQPRDGALNVAIGTDIVVSMSEPIDPATATSANVVLETGSVKVPADLRVGTGGTQIVLDPRGPLELTTSYVVRITSALRDPSGNGAVPFTSTFQTLKDTWATRFPADDVGIEVSGKRVGGGNVDDRFGASVAAVGDADGDGVADLVVGAPYADAGPLADVGKVSLVYGDRGMQWNGPVVKIDFVGTAPGERAGDAVARSGNVSGDLRADFAIGAPGANTATGRVYVVFGGTRPAASPQDLASLAACVPGSDLCGTVFEGEQPGDAAGAAVAWAGDVDEDGHDDLLIGAPGADADGRTDAGKVYLVYGPIPSGTIPLAGVGITARGIVFLGEGAGDRAGEAVSWWTDPLGADDVLIGAPGASPLDKNGEPIAQGGYVYAIHGGLANLEAHATGGRIALSQVASGQAGEVTGFVYLGASPGLAVGRSVTGAVDLDADGVPDIAIGADGEAWTIPGAGPKTGSGSSDLDRRGNRSGPIDVVIPPTQVARVSNGTSAAEEWSATWFVPGAEGQVGPLEVGGGGDTDGDGVDDLVIGSAGHDPNAVEDAGTAYIVFGSPVPREGEVLLSEVGGAVAGFVVDGTEAGDGFGTSVGGGLDVNADGISDALVGAPWADGESTPLNAGEGYVISPVAPPESWGFTLTRAGTIATLEWERTTRAVSYDLYRWVLSQVRATRAVLTSEAHRLACAVATDADADGRPDTTDPDVPGPGDPFLYLVTGRNRHGDGALGREDTADLRVNDLPCP